ncbi:HIT family protein [Candidatus Woesearchaeota archaeon]|nr:HIT family protein [Candidatus Woesearchaeota archaeon]
MDENCIFCKIINGQIPSTKIYENDYVYAFLDIMPVNKGHTLVVPKKHSKNLLEDDVEDLKHCVEAVQKIAPAIVRAVEADGFNLGVNTNKAAGQAVFHTHFHIIPRHEEDGLRPWPQRKYDEGEIDPVKEKIIKALEK